MQLLLAAAHKATHDTFAKYGRAFMPSPAFKVVEDSNQLLFEAEKAGYDAAYTTCDCCCVEKLDTNGQPLRR
jgi:hypothetical protein